MQLKIVNLGDRIIIKDDMNNGLVICHYNEQLASSAQERYLFYWLRNDWLHLSIKRNVDFLNNAHGAWLWDEILQTLFVEFFSIDQHYGKCMYRPTHNGGTWQDDRGSWPYISTLDHMLTYFLWYQSEVVFFYNWSTLVHQCGWFITATNVELFHSPKRGESVIKVMA